MFYVLEEDGSRNLSRRLVGINKRGIDEVQYNRPTSTVHTVTQNIFFSALRKKGALSPARDLFSFNDPA